MILRGPERNHADPVIRHAYVRSAHQHRGVDGSLLTALAGQTAGPLLVGTWTAAE